MRHRRTLAALLLMTLHPFFVAASERSCPLGSEGSERFRVVGGRGFSFVSGRTREVRSESSYCLGCHDATVAPQILMGLARNRGGTAAAPEVHPVDVPYPAESPEFRRLSDLDPRLVLEQGNVTCQTCHSGTNPADRYLSMEPRKLCLECHLK